MSPFVTFSYHDLRQASRMHADLASTTTSLGSTETENEKKLMVMHRPLTV